MAMLATVCTADDHDHSIAFTRCRYKYNWLEVT